ncbi:putative methylmalonate-semialdehyde dehydrogenase [acylating] [Besnoitia besnoiti]|uniref:Putative methylmalonate-semialdehyde dehydrogenase [acylating] n=1 Tax=Besnoitia besnoiti TaxID=94643 RepID=A0A2A9MFG1_BESBE|nr:putative methylmalonate-semialdehyde dehydrogenase [acylating] [Besnoitia besnoiti]PFH34132.1 putative methylmalonate-semialdehyde dehydrogenase [acylating] [Besnoitia besnoiti]
MARPSAWSSLLQPERCALVTPMAIVLPRIWYFSAMWRERDLFGYRRLETRAMSTCMGRLVPFMKDGKVPMFIDNEFVTSRTNIVDKNQVHLVHCPSTNDLLAVNPQPSETEVRAAIQSCKAALPGWQRLSLSKRKKFLLSFLNALESGKEELADIITYEQGKTLRNARAEVQRGIEAVDESLSVASFLRGETMHNVTEATDCFTYKLPLGVCTGITPFNFPAMIPLWMFPIACLAGNTFLLKPSERTPLAAMKLMSFVKAAGWPKGVVNVVHGDARTAKLLCADPTISAVSFVGSNRAGEQIYKLCGESGKRAQCNMGAKNHAVIMPDADREEALNGVVSAAFGDAGQRCMSISVVLLVGEAGNWLEDLLLRASALKVGAADDPSVDVGPLISKESRIRIKEAVKQSVREGAKVVLDGLHSVVEGHPNGTFLGPTVLEIPHLNITAYTEELFGPVLCVKKVASIEEAIALVNSSKYGNGTAVFTRSGSTARFFQQSVSVGQVGINVPIPLPLPSFSFTGWNNSMRGALHFNGKMGVDFFTKTQTISARWGQNDSAPPSDSLSTYE